MDKTYFNASLLKANTENGRSWLEKYLHPPTAKGNSYNGYPDKSTTPTIHTEYRLAYENLPIASTQGVNDNTCLFLCSPGMFNPIFKADVLDGNDPLWTPALVNTQIDARTAMDNLGRVRTAYQSETFQYDATAFNNSGICYSAQFNPSTYVMTTGEAFRVLQAQKSKHLPDICRHLVKLHGAPMAEFIRSMHQDDADGFDVVSNDTRSGRNSVGAININFNAFQVVKLDKSITNPGDITMLSPKAYQSRSVDGAFIVHQCNEDTNAFKSVRGGRYVSGNNAQPLLTCCYEYNDGTNSYIEPFFSQLPGPGTRDFVQDIEWSDWSWSYAMFTGCTPKGTTPLNINIKYIAGFEVAPVVRSILNSQALPPALYDPVALETAAILTQSRQDAMPAAMNSAGVLAAVGSSLATSAVASIAKAISGSDAPPAEEKQITRELRSATNVTAPEREPVTGSNIQLNDKPAPKRANRAYAASATPGIRNLQRELSQLRKSMSSMRMQRPSGRGRSLSASSRPRSRSGSRNRSASRKPVVKRRTKVYFNSRR